MILPFSSFVGASLIAVVFQRNFVAASVATPESTTAPACSATCTLTLLAQNNCPPANIQNCLCRNNTLLFDLSMCVISTCNYTERNAATNLLQTEICSGVPFDSRQKEIIQIEIIIATVTYPIILLRFVSRLWVARKIWWDDWMVIFATILMIPNTTIPIYSAYHGFGIHVWDVRVQDEVILQQLYLTAQVFYAVIQNLAKLSILFLYLRIFPTPRFRLAVQGCSIVVVCHTIAFTGKCIDINPLAITGASLSIFYDIVIILLPIRELIGLNLTIRKRIAICFMFALGSFACVCSLIRLKYLKNFFPSIDDTWNSVDVVIWSDIETYMAVICSCLMCIRPLLTKVFPGLFPSSQASHSHSNANSDPAYIAHKPAITASSWGKGKRFRSSSHMSASFRAMGGRDYLRAMSDGESQIMINQRSDEGECYREPQHQDVQSDNTVVRVGVEYELEQSSERVWTLGSNTPTTPPTPLTPIWFANGNRKSTGGLGAHQGHAGRLVRMSSRTL